MVKVYFKAMIVSLSITFILGNDGGKIFLLKVYKYIDMEISY